MDISKKKKKVILINPKLLFPKSIYSNEYEEYEGNGAFDQKSINIGLLAIASYLDAKGHDVEILDLQDHINDCGDLIDCINKVSPDFIGISCNSCYSYIKTKEYSRLIKSIDKKMYIFSGGQHIGAIARIAANEIPEIDCIIKYEGEYSANFILNNEGKYLEQVPGIIYRENGQIIETKDERYKVEMEDLPLLNWRMYPDFKSLVPNIELSRGCKSVCNFCTNYHAYGYKYRSKPAEKIFDEIIYTLKEYGNDKQAIYLGGMNFDLKDENLNKLIDMLEKHSISWRTESRVDCLTSQDVSRMVKAGLEVIDWGLDGVSPKILDLMKKTNDPKSYIEKASRLFYELREINVLNKVNLMFYPGETAETICETLEFFIKNRENIDIVSPKPTMLYPGTVLYNDYEKFNKLYGTRKIETEFWNTIHAYPVHLSYQLSYEHAKSLSLIIERLINQYNKYALNRKSSIGYSNLSEEEYLKLLLSNGDYYNLRFIIDDGIYEKIKELKP